MTIPASKLHSDPVAEALPLHDGPKAYAIGYKNYHDAESGEGGAGGGMASVVKEATVLERKRAGRSSAGCTPYWPSSSC